MSYDASAAAALARAPWLAAEWDLTDLQILARGGIVQSSLADPAIRFRAGDPRRVAVMFVGVDGRLCDPAPQSLRLTLRDAANAEAIATCALDPAEPQDDRPAPYYLLDPDLSSAAEYLPAGATEIPALLDIEWILDGKTRSSRTAPAIVEIGLTPQALSASAPAPAAPQQATPVPAATQAGSTPTTGSGAVTTSGGAGPVATPAPATPSAPSITEAQVRQIAAATIADSEPAIREMFARFYAEARPDVTVQIVTREQYAGIVPDPDVLYAVK